MATLGGRRFGPLTLGGRPDYQALFPAPKFVPTGSLTATPRTIGGSIEGGIAGALHKFGLSEKRAAQYGRRIMAPLNDVTPVGNVTGAEDGANLFRSGLTQGNLKAMGLGAGVFGLSVLPGPVGKKAGRAAKGMFGNMMRDTSGAIRAWHGSPHDFDRFDMSKIGTGEGAQAYGHGLYFAENPKVAEAYRDTLGPAYVAPPVTTKAREAYEMALGEGLTGKDAIQRGQSILDGMAKAETNPYTQRSIYDAVNNLDQIINKPAGRLYEVNINAEPEDFLDWDRPLSEQPVLPRLSQSHAFLEAKRLADDEIEQMKAIAPGFSPSPFEGRMTGESYQQWLAGKLGKPNVAGDLLGAGIPGIKYFDQGSRVGADGTRNYVVFDDSLVSILNKL